MRCAPPPGSTHRLRALLHVARKGIIFGRETGVTVQCELTGNSFIGTLETVSIDATIRIESNTSKKHDKHPDYRVMTKGFEIGAGWIKKGKESKKDYVSISLAAPEFGSKPIYCNLGKAAGQDDEDVFALIWNPAEE